MPEDIKNVLEILKYNGYSAYLVGGSVRDYLMGNEPSDFDVTTSAMPDDVERIFEGQVLYTIGRAFGTVVIKAGEYEVEITTFRIESEYEDSRRPDRVEFTDRVDEDLKRRDFTINGMAMDLKGNVIDLFGGKEDIENRLIKAIGNANDRILEDGLRVLRAIRFASRFNFRIDDDLKTAIRDNKNVLNNISKERINKELSAILLSDVPSRGLRIMEEVGVLEILFPELQATVGYDQRTPYHSRTLFEHLLCVVDNVPKDLDTRVAALFHDIAKPQTLFIDENNVGHFYGHDELGSVRVKEILRKYKFSKKEIESVSTLVKNHMKAHDEMSDRALRRQIRNVGAENILKLYDLMISDRFCTTINRDINFLKERKLRVAELLKEDTSKENFLNINGKDIMNLGYKEGKVIGEILSYLKEKVLDDPKLNEKNTLIDLVKKYRS